MEIEIEIVKKEETTKNVSPRTLKTGSVYESIQHNIFLACGNNMFLALNDDGSAITPLSQHDSGQISHVKRIIGHLVGIKVEEI